MELTSQYRKRHEKYEERKIEKEIEPLETEFEFATAWQLLQQKCCVASKEQYDREGLFIEMVDVINKDGDEVKQLIVWNEADTPATIKRIEVDLIMRNDWILIE